MVLRFAYGIRSGAERKEGPTGPSPRPTRIARPRGSRSDTTVDPKRTSQIFFLDRFSFLRSPAHDHSRKHPRGANMGLITHFHIMHGTKHRGRSKRACSE